MVEEQKLPYDGAKDMLPCTILEDREMLQKMVMEMWEELTKIDSYRFFCIGKH